MNKPFDFYKFNNDYIKSRYMNLPPIGYNLSISLQNVISELESQIGSLNDKHTVLSQTTLSREFYDKNIMDENDQKIYDEMSLVEGAIESNFISLISIYEIQILNLYHTFEKQIKSFVNEYLKKETSKNFYWSDLSKILREYNVDNLTLRSIDELRRINNQIKHNLMYEPIRGRNIAEFVDSTCIKTSLSTFYNRKYTEINLNFPNIITKIEKNTY